MVVVVVVADTDVVARFDFDDCCCCCCWDPNCGCADVDVGDDTITMELLVSTIELLLFAVLFVDEQGFSFVLYEFGMSKSILVIMVVVLSSSLPFDVGVGDDVDMDDEFDDDAEDNNVESRMV